jgi:ABC-type phosphate transport system substrate-binding protein
MAMALTAALTGVSGAETNLNGAGATFPNPIYQKWFTEYHNAHNDVQINYQSIGSGGGIKQLQAGTVDFGASDGPMTDEQLSQTPMKVFHIPTVLGAVVPTYNIQGVTGELKFSGDVIADIYLGNIKKWNDARLAKDNPGVKFPDEDIAVVHAAGQFVKASLDSVTAAAASVKDMPDDFRVSITNAPGKTAYPISSFTWLLVPAEWSDAGKEKAFVDFLNWMVDKGQAMTGQLSYAPLPKSVAQKVKARIKEVKAKGQTAKK